MVYTVLINCQQIDIPKANVEYIPSQTQNECGKNCESRQVASHCFITRIGHASGLVALSMTSSS